MTAGIALYFYQRHPVNVSGDAPGGTAGRAERGSSPGETGSGQARPGVPGSSETGRGADIDWNSVADAFAKLDEDNNGEAEINALRGKIGTLSGQQLVAAIGNIEALGLDADLLEVLQDLVMERLVGNSPQLALETFTDRIKDNPDSVGWHLSTALRNLAKSDPQAASQWLDRQIAAGLFKPVEEDEFSSSRLEFEAALAGVLLGGDPVAAEARITALPEEVRGDALEGISITELGPDAQRNYADLVRSLLPEDEREASLTSLTDDIATEGGFKAVDRFLDNIGATAPEREAAVRQAVDTQITGTAGERTLTMDDISGMRAWASRYAPDAVDELTGQALADAAQDGSEFSYEQAEPLVRDIFRKTGSEQIVVGFLKAYAARMNLEEALPVADLIADPAHRQSVLDLLRQESSPDISADPDDP